MQASQKMEVRAILHDRLTVLDHQLAILLGTEKASNRTAAMARDLLHNRSTICDELLKVGFHPWDLPFSMNETKVSDR